MPTTTRCQTPLLPEMNLKYSVDPDELSNQEFYKSGITTVGADGWKRSGLRR
jgi:hypothetical protein